MSNFWGAVHENASRTTGSLFEHRMRIPYRRRPSPVPNATTARKEETIAKSAARGAAASKKITAKKFAMPPQSCSTPPGRADVAKINSMPPQICPKPPESSRLIPEVLQCHLEMPIVPYRSLSQDVPIYKKSTLHRCKVLFGAENGARTRDLNLGKVALYQLSYFRNITPYLAVGSTKVRSFF